MNNIKIEELISAEVNRLSEKYKKDYLDLKDIMQITGLGRDKVREIMSSKQFPSSKFGKKKTVSVVAFVSWQFKNNMNGDIYG